jgi:4-hydroxythreonine-4-phosphate dehydrogenase
MSNPKMDTQKRSDRPTIAVSIGDPNGIGPEILLKCLADPRIQALCSLRVVGPSSVLAFYRDHLGRPEALPLALEHDQEGTGQWSSFRVRPGMIDPQAGSIAMEAVARAVDLCVSGDVDAMVTCPISKEAISLAGYDFPGHTEFIAERLGGMPHLMMMVSDHLRVGLVTGHIPLSSVAQKVTGVGIRSTFDLMVASLKRDFGFEKPKIAILGLNPHAGDGGVLGTEDATIILPEVIRAREDGCDVIGPLPADGFFGSTKWRTVDGVIAMYHDQGLIPFKALSFGSGVNFTAGLPIVRTSPDHGTAFDISGSGIASESSLIKAIEYAVDIVQKRNKSD